MYCQSVGPITELSDYESILEAVILILPLQMANDSKLFLFSLDQLSIRGTRTAGSRIARAIEG